MRKVSFATLIVLASIASTARLAAADTAAGTYLAADPDFVQYINVSVSGNVASGFLEVIHYDEKAGGALDRRQIALTGLVEGHLLVFGPWIVDSSPERLVITYPRQTGSLREARFERSDRTQVNAAVTALGERAQRAQVTSRSDDARREITGALAQAAANALGLAQLQLAREASIARGLAAKQQLDAIAAEAKAKHVQADAAVAIAKDAAGLRAAAQQVQSAMYADVATGRAQAYLTQTQADVLTVTDDLAVLKAHSAALQTRIVYLRGVIAQQYAFEANAARGNMKREFKNFSFAHSLGIILDL